MFKNQFNDICPKCKEPKLHPVEVRNALSRKDNETYICSDCGRDEALEEFQEWERNQK